MLDCRFQYCPPSPPFLPSTNAPGTATQWRDPLSAGARCEVRSYKARAAASESSDSIKPFQTSSQIALIMNSLFSRYRLCSEQYPAKGDFESHADRHRAMSEAFVSGDNRYSSIDRWPCRISPRIDIPGHRFNCTRRAATESFFSTMKTERTKRSHYSTRETARVDVFNYIVRSYNPLRRHSTLGHLSPVKKRDIGDLRLRGLSSESGAGRSGGCRQTHSSPVLQLFQLGLAKLHLMRALFSVSVVCKCIPRTFSGRSVSLHRR